MIELKDYIEETKAKFQKIIEFQKNSLNKNEDLIQKFIEKHPTAIWSALEDVEANYNIHCNLIISQPHIKSLEKDRKPDFLVVTENSLNLYFNFIELEDPSKKIFNKNEQKPTTDFFNAYNQLKQWNSFKRNEVKDYCKHLSETIFSDNFNSKAVQQHHYNYILVYGFSEEVNENGSRHNNILQDYFNEKNFHHCTYSRLLNRYKYGGKLISVKKNSIDKFEAIGMTPFTKYDKDEWYDYHNITNKDKIINESEYLTEDEKIKVIERIAKMDKKTPKEIFDEQLNSFGIDLSDRNNFEI